MKFWRAEGTNLIDKKVDLFFGYKHIYQSDLWIEQHIFEKDTIRITFWEELREHEMNLKIENAGSLMADIAYRTCKFIDPKLVDGDILQKSLFLIKEDQVTRDIDEVELYLRFLQSNHFIRAT